MKISPITFVFKNNNKPSQNKIPAQSQQSHYDCSSCEILGIYNKVNFSKNYGKNIENASIGFKKEENNEEKIAKILKTLHQQNRGCSGIVEKYQDKIIPTNAIIGNKKYDYRYVLGKNSDLYIQKNFLAYRKNEDVVEYNFKENTHTSFKEPHFKIYDFTQQVKEKFFRGENDECAEDLRDFYIKNKNSKHQKRKTRTDNGILSISDDGNISLYFIENGYIKSLISTKVNKKGEIVSYSTRNSVPNGFHCQSTYCYSYLQ